MNARIDAQMIPDGICAFEMEIAHYLNGSHSYAEDLHSVIRKFASRLNQCYFLELNSKVRKLLKSLYPNACYYSEEDRFLVLINLLDLKPARIDQLSIEKQSLAISEEIIFGKMSGTFRKYLRIGDSCSWNWFCRWLLIAYSLWATKTGFIKDLRRKYGDDFYLRSDLFGDAEFWDNFNILFNLLWNKNN